MFALATAILISLPSAATAQVYPSVPAPVLPGAAPQRLSPRQVFHWLDTNHDGFLSLGEFLAAPWIKNKQRATQFFYWMDTNKDGRVSLEEFLAAYTRYRGDGGYWIRTAYPWAWNCWRPWRYGWYWQGGWHRRPGVWGGYAGHVHGRVARPYHHGWHAGHHPGRHHHAGKHVRPPRSKHHGNHKGHGHAHGHARSHSHHR
jgi:hypothetical protein